jgi:hypothetical protein
MNKILLVGLFFLPFFVAPSLLFSQIDRYKYTDLIQGKSNILKVTKKEMGDFFVIPDDLERDTVLLKKQWLYENSDRIDLIYDTRSLAITTNLRRLVIKDQATIDSILSYEDKFPRYFRFPRPFRPKKY